MYLGRCTTLVAADDSAQGPTHAHTSTVTDLIGRRWTPPKLRNSVALLNEVSGVNGGRGLSGRDRREGGGQSEFLNPPVPDFRRGDANLGRFHFDRSRFFYACAELIVRYGYDSQFTAIKTKICQIRTFENKQILCRANAEILQYSAV